MSVVPVIMLLVTGMLLPPDASAQYLRLAADFQAFDDAENFTIQGVGTDGLVVYTKTVFVPLGPNTAYVTVSGTGDTHGGAALWLSCRFDGAFCNPGSGGAAGTPPGWISVLKLPDGGTNCNDGGGGGGDCHDNSFYYTWCIPLPNKWGGTHTVAIHMATSDPGSTVFSEAVHYYIDASLIPGSNRCVQFPTASD